MPHDLVQLHPYGGTLVLRTTADDSPTRLLLTLRKTLTLPHAQLGTELDVPQVQELARGLLQWLADCGYAVPMVEQPTYELPEHQR
jgi:hypothetical protein